VRRLFSDAVISALALLLLLAGLVVIDPRVREHAANFVTTSAPSSAAGAGTQLADVTSAIVLAARDQTFDHAPMTIFVVVATVLFVAMFRS
jgi:hypothetical protein